MHMYIYIYTCIYIYVPRNSSTYLRGWRLLNTAHIAIQALASVLRSGQWDHTALWLEQFQSGNCRISVLIRLLIIFNSSTHLHKHMCVLVFLSTLMHVHLFICIYVFMYLFKSSYLVNYVLRSLFIWSFIHAYQNLYILILWSSGTSCI